MKKEQPVVVAQDGYITDIVGILKEWKWLHN